MPTLTRKRLIGRPMFRPCDNIADLAWSRLGVEAAKLSEIAERCGPRDPLHRKSDKK